MAGVGTVAGGSRWKGDLCSGVDASIVLKMTTLNRCVVLFLHCFVKSIKFPAGSFMLKQ